MCSPPAMDLSDDYCVQAKRRRFGDPSSPFLSSSTIGTANSPFAQSYNTGRMGGGTGVSNKRTRSDNGTAVDAQFAQQAAEIASLKQENSKLQGTIVQLKMGHDKALHENKLLKRLVTHQHEKQHQSNLELEEARNYKTETQDRITKMESMIVQLRYHLQAQQTPMTNYMGGFHRPPDVY